MPTLLERAIDWGTRLPGNHITYYFVPGGSGHASPIGNVQTADFVAYEKQQFRLALDLYKSFLNVNFDEVNSPATADLQFISYRANDGTLGAFGPPHTGPTSGIGVFNYAGVGWDYESPGTGALEQGGFGFITIIHELGHGFGLAHPHDHGGGSPIFPGVTGNYDYGDLDLNQGVVTTMSYNDGWKTNPDGLPPDFAAYGFQGTLMALDIAVLQQKYGANWNYHTGNDTYRLSGENAIGTFYSSIWDAGGGRDRIIFTGAAPAFIDLHAASLEVEANGGGVISHVAGIFGGFTIAHGVIIENAFGGSGPDFLGGNGRANLLVGRDGDDILLGGRGADTLNGGDGNDTLNGHGGADTFLFKAAPNAVSNFDGITDFVAGVDKIGLEASVFAVGKPGKLSAEVFFLGSAAQDSSDRIGYDSSTGALIYDADGSGAGAAIPFATLGVLSLASSDFIVI